MKRLFSFIVLFFLLVEFAVAQVFTGPGVEGKRLGEVISLPYNGDVFTASDGSVWKATNSRAIAYTGLYARLANDAPSLVTSGAPLNGPFTNNDWQNLYVREIVGGSAGGNTWLIAPGLNSVSLPDFFYTSTNAGVSWTARTPPVAGKAWYLLWDGVNFVAYPVNGSFAYESTDGISWVSHAAPNLSTINDVFFANNLYVIVSNGTTIVTSPDRVTWTSRTLAANLATPFANSRTGFITYNAGAGLWITGTSGCGGTCQYQTSPDGITWTLRNTVQTNPALLNPNNLRFASNSTTTVALGLGGVVATSTDGINWITQSIIDPTLESSNSVATSTLWYDGTRFIANVTGIIYYSTGGLSWTKNLKASVGTTVLPTRTPLGYMTNNNSNTSNPFTSRIHITNVTSTTNNYIAPRIPTFDVEGSRSYVRIN